MGQQQTDRAYPLESDTALRPANVDMEEVRYYAALANTWWDPNGPFWPLHSLNTLRTGYLRSVLAKAFSRNEHEPKPLSGIRVLDVGCGGGLLSESMAGAGAEVRGIDVVAKNIEVARHHACASGLNVSYDRTTAEALAGRQLTYDVVLNMEVVEHVPDVSALIDDCARLVAPGGLMVVATINRTFLSWLFAIVGAEYVLRWLPRGTHQWHRFVKPDELQNLLRQNAFDMLGQTGVRVNPFNRGFALSPRMAVNYMVVARKRATRPVAA